ncbi:MAG: hypothetical protein AB7N91_02345 [Candidatus Tectimicrobiota bacterium]
MHIVMGVGTYWRYLVAWGRRRGAYLALACSVLLGGTFGQAAMLKMPLEYLASTADTVVLGTVTRQVSAWDSQHTAIHTDVTVQVEQAMLGSAGAEVTFRIAGGIVGGMGMRTSNDARFQDGERVIVFLNTRTTPGSLVGLEQGKLLVQDNMVTFDGEPKRLDEMIAAIRTAVR